MSDRVVFRPRSNLVWGGAAIALDAMFLAQAIYYPSAGENLVLDYVTALALALAGYLLWLRPKVIFEADHLTVINPLGSRKIAYSEIATLDTKWSLTIQHGTQNTRVWVAPTGGKFRWMSDATLRWNNSKLPKTEARLGEFVPASETVNSDSGLLAHLIRARIDSKH